MSQSDAEFGPNKYIKNEDMMGDTLAKMFSEVVLLQEMKQETKTICLITIAIQIFNDFIIDR
jgi:hypothetical protein